MSDRPFREIPSTPWAHVNNVLSTEPSELDQDTVPPQPVDYLDYNEWGAENASGNDLEDLKGSHDMCVTSTSRQDN